MLMRIILLVSLIFSCAALAFAQEEKSVSFDASRLPRTADAVEKFVPAGWMIEAQISGDLNNDGLPDVALELIEKPAANADKDNPASRSRVLLILFKNQNGEFGRAAAAKTLLQCTRCGGAFYGIMEAPANVEIAKGILVIKQDGGSRNVTENTFRFRYNPGVKKFMLIGYDTTDRDRATGETVSESTNYLTGVKVTETFQYSQKLDRDIKKSSRQTGIKKSSPTLETINYETFGND